MNAFDAETIVVTGAAGFIGMHCSLRLLALGARVVGVDSLNNYYDIALKRARLQQLSAHRSFAFEQQDVADKLALAALFERERPNRVLHLAAQVGVRNSIDNPHAYTVSNLLGFANILEVCRHHKIVHLTYASSSSVYGNSTALPYSERGAANHPISYYAATKKAAEGMAHSYAHLYGLACTGLRFFTVYGPWGRPDMAYYKFARAISAGHDIDLYDRGEGLRDFTYIDDICEGVVRTLAKPATPDPKFDPACPSGGTSSAPWRIFNIGGSKPVSVLTLIHELEAALGKKASVRSLPAQPGDMRRTQASSAALSEWIGFVPETPLAEGVRRFAAWYRTFYGP